jgi:hypothetical protein
MKEKRVKRRYSDEVEVVKTWVDRFRSGTNSEEDMGGEMQRLFESRVLEQLLPRMFWQEESSLRSGILRLSRKLLGIGAVPLLKEVLAKRNTSLSEKRCALQQLGELGEGVDERYIQDIKVCEKVLATFLRYGEESERLGQNDVELMRDTLKAINPVLRYGVLQELIHQFPKQSVPFLTICFGEDPKWDQDLVDLLEGEAKEWVPDFLIRWLEKTTDKNLAKRIKKILHTLRTQGIPVPAIDKAKEGPPVWIPPVPPKAEGFVSSPDSTGTRIVWLIRHRHPKGFYLFSALVNEHKGLMDFVPVELSSKQGRAYKDEIPKKKDVWVVEADPRYCAFLIDEAYQKTPVKEGPILEAYVLVKALIQEMRPKDTPCPLIYTVLEVGESGEDPLGETRRLLDHPLLAGWRLEGEKFQPFSSKLQDIENSKIIVHPLQKKDRVESLYTQSAREIFSDEGYRKVWKRRLEETAWIFYKKGYEQEAHLAVRVASLLSNTAEDPSKSPFLMELIRRSIDQSLEEKKRHDTMQPSLIVKP